jgi:fumarate reductase (CoM/CoB) subunit A
VNGLYACGQVQGGVMGGNRLGSTSLTEIFVFGRRAGRTAADEARGRDFADEEASRDPLEKLRSLRGSSGSARPIQLKRALQGIMWERVGTLRDARGLEGALEEIRALGQQVGALQISDIRRCNREILEAVELPHMLSAAQAIAVSALGRTESRGAHVRSDFPEYDNAEPLCNMVVQMREGSLELRRVAVNP